MVTIMRYYMFVLAVILLSSGCRQGKDQHQGEADIFHRINLEVKNNSRAYITLKEASQTIGHRLTGSANGKKAEQYAYDLLKGYGYNDVKFQPFEVEAWSRGDVSLGLAGPGREGFRDVPVVSLAHSPEQARVTAEVVDVGNGLKKDFEEKKEAVKGKIVLAYIGLLPGSGDGNNLHRSEKTALAIAYGARGIIIINQVEGGVLLTGTASVTGNLIPIPAVNVGYETGMALKERLRKEVVTAKIEMTNSSSLITARNVIATLKGTEKPEEVILVGGHLDSWDLATGAIDNGIGSFAVLDIARTFKALDLKPKRTIQFVMFMGEEQGLLGSKALIDNRIEEGILDQVKYMVNLDMSGNPVGFNAGGRKEAADFFEQKGELIRQVDNIFTNSFKNRAGLHSDHQPFMLEGIPVMSLVSNLDHAVYDCYHSDCDDFSLVNKKHLKNTVRFTSMMLHALVNAPELPAKKMDSEATRKFLVENGLKEELVLGGSWRWGE